MSKPVFLYLSNIPASETYPFTVTLVSVNNQKVEQTLFESVETLEQQTKVIEFEIEIPTIAKHAQFEILFNAKKIQVQSNEKFDLSKGNYILFGRVPEQKDSKKFKLEIRQREDENFGYTTVEKQVTIKATGNRTGGFVINPKTGEKIMVSESGKSNTTPFQPATSSTVPLFDELEKLKQLFDKGILTKEEFEAKKKQVLGI